MTSSAPTRRIPVSHGRDQHLDTLELFARCHEDDQARAALVERFMPLARKLALRYVSGNEPLDDLVQVASLGLVKAVDRYRPERGTAFTSFAVPTILGELKRHFRDRGWAVHVPRGSQELALKVERARDELTEASNRAPTVQQLAEHLELGVDEVLDAIEVASAHYSTSLDLPADDADQGAGTLLDTIGRIDPGYEQVNDRVTVADAAARGLSERDREVLRMRVEEELSQAEIAKRIGVSQMQVSRILRRAIATLSELAAPVDS